MNSREALQRPFSTWSFPPFPDEPAYGYFARLVAAEEHSSSRVYANEIGLNGRDIVPVQQLSSILCLPIPDDWKERVKHATPLIVEDGVMLGGEIIRDKQFSIAKRRFCPGCLGEAAYHRVWWDILSITECPFHRLPIEDWLPDGRPLMWWWPHFDHSPKGDALGRRGIVRHDPDGTFAGYLLSRIGLCRPTSAPLLDGLSLHEAIDLCDLVGRLLTSPRSERYPPSAIGQALLGFEALRLGPAHFLKALREWLRREVPEDYRRRGHAVAFGWIARRQIKITPDMLAILSRALKKAVAAENRRSPRELTDADFDQEDVGIEALAQELGIVRRGVAHIADRLGILPKREWYRARVHFDEEEAAMIREFMEDVITTEEVNRILGLPPGQLGTLAKEGFIDRLVAVSQRGERGSRYSKPQVERFLANILDGVPEADIGDSLSLIVCARRLGLESGKLIAMVAKGELSPVCRQPGSTGLTGLRFLVPSLSIRRTKAPKTTPQTLGRIREIALSNPMAGPGTISKMLASEGTTLSPPGVRKHLIRMGLGKQEDRVKAVKRTSVGIHS